MLVTTSIKLDRKLLHSWATSSRSPGIDRVKPSCVTGTPAAENSRLAESAEYCCQMATILFNACAGIGTSQNRKHRGNRNTRATRGPKQNTNDPIHQITTASIPKESRVSLDKPAIQREQPAIRIAIAKRAESTAVGSNPGFNPAHSVKIKAALTGRIRSKWVYSSARSARARALDNWCQPITIETAHKRANLP